MKIHLPAKLNISFSRERLAEGSGLVGNYCRVEVACRGGSGSGIRGGSAEASAENPRKKDPIGTVGFSCPGRAGPGQAWPGRGRVAKDFLG